MTELERLQAENARLRKANKILLGDDEIVDEDDVEEFDESQLETIDNASNKAEGKSAK